MHPRELMYKFDHIRMRILYPRFSGTHFRQSAFWSELWTLCKAIAPLAAHMNIHTGVVTPDGVRLYQEAPDSFCACDPRTDSSFSKRPCPSGPHGAGYFRLALSISEATCRLGAPCRLNGYPRHARIALFGSIPSHQLTALVMQTPYPALPPLN